MSQILDRLWLGAVDDACSEVFLRWAHITHVLNCAVECPPSRIYPSGLAESLAVQHLPLEDDEDGGEPEEIVEGARTLHEWLDASGACVLVHCMAGISRSPTIVIAYLILFKGMGYEEAYTFVAAKRNFIRPIPYWLGILRGLEVVREAVLAAAT